jgi:hypothetical protein
MIPGFTTVYAIRCILLIRLDRQPIQGALRALIWFDERVWEENYREAILKNEVSGQTAPKNKKREKHHSV